jgi:hypothetical protein
MFAVYEINTGEIVATFTDWRRAMRRADMLTQENEHDGYEYSVKQLA